MLQTILFDDCFNSFSLLKMEDYLKRWSVAVTFCFLSCSSSKTNPDAKMCLIQMLASHSTAKLLMEAQMAQGLLKPSRNLGASGRVTLGSVMICVYRCSIEDWLVLSFMIINQSSMSIDEPPCLKKHMTL